MTYAPSLAARAACVARARAERGQTTALALVDPGGDLPGAAAEGDILEALLPRERVRVLRGSEATLVSLATTARGHDVIHLGCHGSYEWDDLPSSALDFADASLKLSEVASDLDLSGVRLVVLSACDSGLSNYFPTTEEHLGFPAAFLEAGASGVISTLWPVDDDPTCELFARFYRVFLVDGVPPARALRLAQQWVRDARASELRRDDVALAERPYANPFYWAAFTYAGA